MTGHTDSELIDEAARRFLRLREDGDDAARISLRRWMAMDLRHAAAIDLVERGWRRVGALAPAPPKTVPWRRAAARRFHTGVRLATPRRLGWAAGLAAALLLMVGAEYRGIGVGWPHHYATHTDMQTIALADGSVLRLQPHSRATVRLSLLARDIALDAGGAAFAVAHEALRPFVVRAGTIGVEATGTRFSVTTGSAGTHVALWHGGVRLRDQASDAVLATLKPGDRAAIGSGSKLVLTRARPTPPTPARVFVFDNTPLAEAVAQITAGTGLHVRFARPALARLPVSSVYHGDNLPAFLDDLGAVESICWQRRGTIIQITEATSVCRTK